MGRKTGDGGRETEEGGGRLGGQGGLSGRVGRGGRSGRGDGIRGGGGGCDFILQNEPNVLYLVSGTGVVTRGLDVEEFVEGAEEGAVEGGVVTVDFGEEFLLAGADEDEAGVGVGGHDGSAGLVGAEDFAADAFLVDVVQAHAEEGFGHVDAAETPCDVGELVDEEGFGGSLGVVFGVEGLTVGVEVFALFAEEDGGLGGEGVFEGVERGDGFAFGGAGAGAFECVGAVGEEAAALGEGGEAVGACVKEVFDVGVQ